MRIEALVLLSLLVGCTPSTAREDASRPFDSGIPGLSPSPDGEGYCCPAAVPSCECRSMGGFVATPAECTRDFRRVCDVHPNDWIRETDPHGCMGYRPRSWTEPLTNCFPAPPRRDAGFTGDTNLPSNVQVAPGGGFCCLPDTPSCACIFPGATAETPEACAALRVHTACGGDPVYWQRDMEWNGCPIYIYVGDSADGGSECASDASVESDAGADVADAGIADANAIDAP